MSNNNRKMSAKKKQERIALAQERERDAVEKKARRDFWKKAFILAVCVILALALSLPTMALMVMGRG